jgi:L-lactate dehydrogenase
VGVSIADVVHSIALDSNRIMPVSSLQNGLYGLRDVSISVPTVVGRTGVLGCIEVDLWPKEKMALQNSGKVLRETLDRVLKG